MGGDGEVRVPADETLQMPPQPPRLVDQIARCQYLIAQAPVAPFVPALVHLLESLVENGQPEG